MDNSPFLKIKDNAIKIYSHMNIADLEGIEYTTTKYPWMPALLHTLREPVNLTTTRKAENY